MKKVLFRLIVILGVFALFMLSGCSGKSSSGTNTSTYSLGGTVSDLSGTGLVLQNNGGDDLTISTNGTFTFATKVTDTAAYDITIKIQPAIPAQTCMASNGTGIVSGVSVTNVTISCSAATRLQKTGQTSCYDASGTLVSCSTTTLLGQDGALQKGVAWLSPRFTVASSGTGTVVNDNLTGLIWQQDGSTPTVGWCTGGAKNWWDALNYCVFLSYNNYLGYKDWRLPNVDELKSLVNYGQSNPATWLDSQGFANTQSSFYWSSTFYAPETYVSWGVFFGNGSTIMSSTTSTSSVRCVRGQSGSSGSSIISLPQTGQDSIVSSTVGESDGGSQAGTAWPSPRFTVVSSGTGTVVNDNLTGLIWPQDAFTAKVGLCTGGLTSWQGAFDYVACLNANNYLGHNDWRLPNVNELQSLVNAGQSNTALWLMSQGFGNQMASPCWSSTTYAPDVTRAWYVDLGDGSDGYLTKTGTGPSVLCVRGGQ